jgi:PAS domain S-box-containing protein
MIFLKTLSKIKSYYSEGPLVEKDLKDLFETLNIKMYNMKGVLKDLIKAEHRYQSLFEVNRDAIVILDYKSGLIIEANKETEKILNRNLEDIVGIHPLEFLSPEEYSKFKNTVMQQITENLPPSKFELKLLNGKIIPVEILVGKVQVGGQNLIQVNFRDITERLKSEKALQESERRNRALLNSIPDNILEIKKDGKIVFFKSPKELEKVLDPKEFIDKNIFEVLPKRIAQIIIDYIQRTLQTQNTQEFYFKIPFKNAEYKFEARMVPYSEESVITISKVIYIK